MAIAKFSRRWAARRIGMALVSIVLIGGALAIGPRLRGEVSGSQWHALVFLALALVLGWKWLWLSAVIAFNWLFHDRRVLYVDQGALVFVSPSNLRLPMAQVQRLERDDWTKGQTKGVNLLVRKKDGGVVGLPGFIFDGQIDDIVARSSSILDRNDLEQDGAHQTPMSSGDKDHRG